MNKDEKFSTKLSLRFISKWMWFLKPNIHLTSIRQLYRWNVILNDGFIQIDCQKKTFSLSIVLDYPSWIRMPFIQKCPTMTKFDEFSIVRDRTFYWLSKLIVVCWQNDSRQFESANPGESQMNTNTLFSKSFHNMLSWGEMPSCSSPLSVKVKTGHTIPAHK